MKELGQSIQIATVFFILSLISERFITWFKLYFFKKGNTLFGYFFNWDEDYSVKSDDPVFEKKREEKILALNISLSILIAFIINANLFTLLTGDPTNSLGWQNFEFSREEKIDWSFIFLEFIGCIVGGLLMSLGSKFWHDTLDMLFYAKNLKEKLGNTETFKMNTLKELDEWIALTDADIVKKVFEENLALLKDISNVISVGIGHDANNNKHIEVIINNSNSSLIPKVLPYNLPNGNAKLIPVNTIQSSTITTQVLKIGDDLTNKSNPQAYGSYGLAVKFKNDKTNKRMLLTCYHVVIGPQHNYNLFQFINDEKIISPHGDTKSVIGNIRTAIRNVEVDVALVDINTKNNITNILPDSNQIKDIRIIEYNEKYSDISVSMYGFNKKPNVSEGKIRSINNHITIQYTLPSGKKENWDLYDLIAISNNNEAISSQGDSGSAIIDTKNNVIGIVVAGNATTTYAIPIKTIFNQLNIQLL